MSKSKETSKIIEGLKEKTRKIHGFTPIELPQFSEFNDGNSQFYVKNWLTQYQYYLVTGNKFQKELNDILPLYLMVWNLVDKDKNPVFSETDIDILLDSVNPILTKDIAKAVSDIVIDNIVNGNVNSVDDEKKD